MRACPVVMLLALALSAGVAGAQSPDLYSAMHWRQIGPTRAGRAPRASPACRASRTCSTSASTTAASGAPPTTAPTGCRSSTTSRPARSARSRVAPSDPNIIYVGTGAGIIRPDLADRRRHVQVHRRRKDVDAPRAARQPDDRDTSTSIRRIPNRLFVAVLGHPYGPNAERGVFRSTDGGRTFEKVLYKDEYTSGNDVRIDPRNPNIVYATLWQQQQSFIEGAGLRRRGERHLQVHRRRHDVEAAHRRPAAVLQANIAIAPSNPQRALRHRWRPTATAAAAGTDRAFYKSTDGGEHWAASWPPARTATPRTDPRPLARIGGGDLPTVTVDPKNENVRLQRVDRACGAPRTAASPGPRCAARPAATTTREIWINPDNPEHHPRRRRPGRGDLGQSRRVVEQLVHAAHRGDVSRHDRQRVSRTGSAAASRTPGSACVDSRSMDGMITFHDWHPVNIQEYGIAAPDPKDPDMVYGSARTNVSLYNRKTGQTTQVGPDMSARGPERRELQPQRAHDADPLVAGGPEHAVLRVERGVEDDRPRRTAGRASAPTSRARRGTCRPTPASTRAASRRRRWAAITALSPSPRSVERALGRHRRRQHPGDDGRRRDVDATSRRRRSSRGRASSTSRRGTSTRSTAYAAANTLRVDDLNPHFWRTHDGGKTWTEINTGIAAGRGGQLHPRRSAGEGAALRRDRHCRCGSRSTTATTGSRCSSTCRRSRCATSRSRTTAPACAPISWPARTGAASGSSTT